MEKQPVVYIMANRRNGTLYTGVTSNLVKRIWEHKNDLVPGFTNRYAVHLFVYYELLDTMEAAIEREKQIKTGSRSQKLRLIESMNSEWHDLYETVL